jgi:hypothetical protein
MSYIIVKYVRHYETELPVILIDEFGEILNFDGIEDAEDYQKLFQTNSDSGHRYEVKHVSEKI